MCMGMIPHHLNTARIVFEYPSDTQITTIRREYFGHGDAYTRTSKRLQYVTV